MHSTGLIVAFSWASCQEWRSQGWLLNRLLPSCLTGNTLSWSVKWSLSAWAGMNAGVPQSTLLCPVSFLFHVNDLETSQDTIKYVDDCTVWESGSATGVDSKLQTAAINEASTWSSANLMVLNCNKVKELRVCFAKKSPELSPVLIDNKEIKAVSSAALLGVVFSDDLKWQVHCGSYLIKSDPETILLEPAQEDISESRERCACVYCWYTPRWNARARYGILGSPKTKQNSWRASSEGPWDDIFPDATYTAKHAVWRDW